MAQNFVGSNNVNLLVPSGQFGTRLSGGKDHAAARYIYTRLTKATRCIFPEADDAVLEYLNEEGLSIEPKYYAPIIPLVAANGADGIGVGWSCFVPNYNPRELIANVRRMLKKEPLQALHPWYKGFKGSITPIPETSKYEVTGQAVKRGHTRLEITELPVRRWTQDYKEWLLEQLPKAQGAESEHKAQITEVREYHTEHSVHFVLSLTPHKLKEAERRGLAKTFHLKSSVSTSNMMLFDPDGKIKKYESLEEIAQDHFKVRLDVYAKRKAYLLAKLKREMDLVDNKLRFVQLVVSETLEVDGRKAQDLCRDMRKHGLKHKRDIDGKADAEPLTPSEEQGKLGYQYLLSMKLWQLTDDRLQELKKKYQDKIDEIEVLEGTSLEAMWERDLVKLEEALDQMDRDDAKEAEATAKMAKKKGVDEGLVNRQCVLVLSQDFKAKRVGTSQWKAHRSGKKIQNSHAVSEKAKKLSKNGEEEENSADEDAAEESAECLKEVFCCHDFDALLVFTEEGNVYTLQALDIPTVKRAGLPGKPIKECISDLGDEKVAAMVTVPQRALRDQTDEFVILVTKQGVAKKVTINKLRGVERRQGVKAFKLVGDDKLKWALRATENSALVVATENGHAARIACSEDSGFAATTGANTGGKRVLRTNTKSGPLIACTVDKLTSFEMAAVAARKAEALKKKEERLSQASQELKVDEATAVAKPNTPVKKKPEVDDDDSENEAEDAKNEGDDVKNEKNEENDAEDEGEDMDDDDGEGADGDTMMADGDTSTALPAAPAGEAVATGSEAKATGPVDRGTCLLLVTAAGCGARLPVSGKRLQAVKKGKMPPRVLKLHDSDRVVGACIVSGTTEFKPSAKPRSPVDIYLAEKKEALEQEVPEEPPAPPAPTPTEATPEQEASENPASSFEEWRRKMAREKKIKELAAQRFEALSESEQQVFKDTSQAEHKKYQDEIDEYQQAHPGSQEQVMIGTRMGCIDRVLVETVPILDGVKKGKNISKPKGRDQLSTVSLLAAADVEADDEPAPEQSGEAASSSKCEEKPQGEPDEAPDSPQPPPKAKTTPLKIFPLRRQAAPALPHTPPTNKKQAHGAESLAAATLLGTPPASPGRRLRSKMSPSDALSVDNVARPSLARSSKVETHSRENTSANTGRGRGRPLGVRKTIDKHALQPLRLTEPKFLSDRE
jgi:DNA gyrase/topoisomerase IV subunit A